jgi:midasin (ATPase involved in ribosome maturation)
MLRCSPSNGWVMIYFYWLVASFVVPLLAMAHVGSDFQYTVFCADTRVDTPMENEVGSVQGYWIMCGNEPLPDEAGPSVEGFILTATVRAHLRAVARALTMQRQCPVLLQGPTSSGKTTLVEYIARTTGHKTIRINNHQHTDLQV